MFNDVSILRHSVEFNEMPLAKIETNHMSRIFFLLTVILLLVSCGKEPISNNEIIDIKIFSKKIVEKICINDFTDSVSIIPLQTNDNSIFTRIDRIFSVNNRFYILSRKDKALFIFENTGKYISKIQEIGKGPGEYIQLTDFTINTDLNEIVLLANIPNKYLIYNMDGDFVKEIPCKNYFQSVNYTGESYAHYKLAPSKNNDYRITIKKDLDNNSSKEFLSISRKSTFVASFGFPQITLSSRLLFCSSFVDNKIYSINNNKVLPRYNVNFLKAKLPLDFFKYSDDAQQNMKQFQGIVKSNYFYFISGIREYSDYLIFRFQPHYICVFNKNSQKTEVSKRFYDKNHRILLNHYLAHDGNDNFLIFSSNPQSLIQTVEDIILVSKSRSPIESEIISLGKRAKITDNPILFVYNVH